MPRLERLISLAVVILTLTPGVAWAQRAGDVTTLARDLVSDDFRKARIARDELVLAEPFSGLQAVLEARRDATGLAARERSDRVIAALLESLVEAITKPIVGTVPTVIAALGGGAGAARGGDFGAESESVGPSVEEQLAAARTARNQLLALGAPIVDGLVTIPPLRSLDEQRILNVLAQQISEEVRRQVADLAGQPELALARLREWGGNADRAAVVLGQGLRDERPFVRQVFQRYREELMAALRKDLASEAYEVRELAAERILALGAVAKIELDRLATDPEASPDARRRAQQLQHRLRFSISTALFEKLGHAFEDYSESERGARREVILELERLGGADAVPSLRAILRQEVDKDLRMLAALSLARLGDPVGLYQIQREGLASRLAVPKSDLIAIYMDQGIKYLNIRRFAKAEREFERVLELEPKNETALYNLACAYALWGKIAKALDMLERAVDNGFDDVNHIEKDPDLDALRSEPRYQDLIRALEARRGRGER